MSTSGRRFQSPGVFRKITENINVYKFWTSLHISRSKMKIVPSIQINKVKDWTFRFLKKKNTCLIMTSNARNNRQNYRSKFLEKLKQAVPKKWDKSCGMMDQNEQSSCVRYVSCCVNVTGFFQLFFKFNQKLALKIIYVTKTFRRQVCFGITLSLVFVYNKLNYCSLLYRSLSSSFRLLSFLWDCGWQELRFLV